MARSRTLAQMVADARERADMVGSTFITDTTFKQYVSDSCATVYNMLVMARGHAYYQTTTTFVTTSATLYALPADFFELQLAQIDYGGLKQTLRPFMLKEAARWSEMPSQPGYTVTLRYTPAPPTLTLDADTFDGIAGFEQWAVLDAAIKALTKEESDVSVLLAQRAMKEQEIARLAPTRDAQFPDRVIDQARLMRRSFPYQSAPRYRLAAGNIELLWGPIAAGGLW
jgi:hypothetical protein